MQLSKESVGERGASVRSRLFRQRPDFVLREIAGEAFIVPMHGKLAHLRRIFVLSAVGAFIWRRLDGKLDLDGLVDDLVEHFEVSYEEAEADLFEFVGELERAGLIIEATDLSR